MRHRKQFDAQLTFRLPAQHRTMLAAIAKERGVDTADVVREMVAQSLTGNMKSTKTLPAQSNRRAADRVVA